MKDYSKCRILLVDDEQNILRALNRVLKSLGCDIVLANNGADALARLSGGRFALILSDMRMPMIDGAELLSQVAKQYPFVRRIILTGYADLERTMSAINDGGIHRYFTKPWENDELRQAVSEELDVFLEEEDRRQKSDMLDSQNQKLSSKIDITAAMLEQSADLMRASRYQSAVDIQKKLLEKRFPNSLRLCDKVASTSARLARLLGLNPDAIDKIKTAAELHRLGMIALPRDIGGRRLADLTQEEREIWETYPEIGEDALKGNSISDEVATLIRHHREQFNGSGFPDGLVGSYIPLGSRIIGLVTDFEEVQEEQGREVALRFIQSQSNLRYDPQLTAKLISLIQQDNKVVPQEIST